MGRRDKDLPHSESKEEISEDIIDIPLEKPEVKKEYNTIYPNRIYAIIGVKSNDNIKEGKEYHVKGSVASSLIKRGLVKLK